MIRNPLGLSGIAALVVGAGLLGTLPARADRAAVLAGKGHFDPHNHDTGILPYFAYADLDAFIKGGGTEASVSPTARVELFAHILATHMLDYLGAGGAMARMSGGSYATLECAQAKLGIAKQPGDNVISVRKRIMTQYKAQLIGAQLNKVNDTLQRLLSSSPWTAFDSAHAYRGTPAEAYLVEKYADKTNVLLAHATINP